MRKQTQKKTEQIFFFLLFASKKNTKTTFEALAPFALKYFSVRLFRSQPKRSGIVTFDDERCVLVGKMWLKKAKEKKNHRLQKKMYSSSQKLIDENKGNRENQNKKQHGKENNNTIIDPEMFLV